MQAWLAWNILYPGFSTNPSPNSSHKHSMNRTGGKIMDRSRKRVFQPLDILNVFSQSLEQETKGLPSKKGIVQSIVGQGYHRKIVLASQSVQNIVYK